MSVPHSSAETTSFWQRIRPYLTSTAWWFRWLSTGLYVCILFGSLLGRFYFFELFSHFWIQYWVVLAGLVTGSLICQLIFRKPARLRFVLLSAGLLLFSPATNGVRWSWGDHDSIASRLIGDVRVYHANVLIDRSEHQTTVARLRSLKPDLFVLQEMTPASIRLVTGQLRTEFPHWFACWSKKQCWTLVGSRTPIRPDEPLARTRQLIAVTTRVRGRAMSLVTVHPRVPLLPGWFRQRNAQLTEAARLTRNNPLPTVLIGDFNISVFSPIYTDLFSVAAEPLSEAPHGTMRTLESGRRWQAQPTWPDFLPSLLMIPIDHAFVNNGLRFARFSTLSQSGSDHRALLVDLWFSEVRK